MIGVISCNQRPVKPIGRSFVALDSSRTNIQFENIPASNDKLGILYYINYYNGAGVSAGDINNDGFVDIYFAANNKGKNKLYLNKGNFSFEDITEQAGVAGIADWSTGVTMADVNADGLLDIYVCAVSKKHGLKGRNQLFINTSHSPPPTGGGQGETSPSPSGEGRGEVSFREAATEYGLDFSGYSTQAAFFDYDHDGDLDCYILNQSSHPHQNLVDTSYRRKPDSNAGDLLFRNDLNNVAKKFTDVSAQSGIYRSFLGFGLGLAVADLNNDGWEDIYIGNDFHENDYYYVNNGNGTFTESGSKAFNHYSRFSMGNDIADFNNDGNLDVLTVDMLPPDEKILKTYGSDERVDIYNFKIIKNGYQPQFSRNCLQQNNGDGKSFSDIGLIAGVAATDWSWSPLMADFDNDGNKDIFISNGIIKRTADLDYVRFVSDLSKQKQFSNSPNLDEKALEKMPDGSSFCFLFRGNGNGNFEDKSEDWGIAHKKGYFTGASYADFDNDGDLDIVINPVQSKAFIFQNNSPIKSFLQVKFQGDSLNPFGIGAKVYVFYQGRMQYQQLMLTRGFQSSTSGTLHFGLDTVPSIDSLLIVWPDQKFQMLTKVSSNQSILVDKKNAVGKFLHADFFPPQRNLLLALSNPLNVLWKHEEDPIRDFNSQYLIPHALSIRGPRIAVADINKDNLDDFYVCGAAGQPGQLFVQDRMGKFFTSDTLVFLKNAKCEEVDAIFFDANGDGYPDLYVASGGYILKGEDPGLLDKIYLNNGKGHFIKAEKNLPSLYANKSSVSSGDLDGDGDFDLFVGVSAEPGSYGMPQTSYLLVNGGMGNFKLADESILNLKNLGMVSSSAIADLNADGHNDLIVAGEWMPVTVFMNNQNKFSAQKLDSGGLWQSIFITDMNGDGSLDILAGNWGLNSKLAAGKAPLKLYLKDFDNNNRPYPILAYTIEKKEYPFLPKDEIEQVLPFIKKKYLYYSDYAGKPVQEVFDLTANTRQLEAHDLASAVFLNDGKGNFTRKNLPLGLQLSPLFTFQHLENSDTFFAGGNFYGVLPYEGQYDAASLIFFEAGGKNNLDLPVIRSSILDTKAQVRDLKWIRTAKNGNVLVVGRNNGSLLFYEVNK
jgi:enediyne biosynthesis protein E4